MSEDDRAAKAARARALVRILPSSDHTPADMPAFPLAQKTATAEDRRLIDCRRIARCIAQSTAVQDVYTCSC